MLEPALLTLGLAFLLPIGYALIGASGLPRDRANYGAVSLFVALGLAVAGYVITGFALQYGGVGLAHELPGYDGLIWEWSALGVTWGPGWGMAGLTGWLLSGAATTSAARDLALANLPWVVTAALIPVMAFRGRIPGWATALAGFLAGALIYPVASNWVWGGGWLANLGSNLGLAHGFVDAAGAGTVHVLGAAVALAGVLVFLPRRPSSAPGEAASLPRPTFPLLALLGVACLLVGLPAWISSNPLLPANIEVRGMFLNTIVAAAGASLASLGYTWLVAGRPDALMAARAIAAAVIGSMAASAFIPTWGALALGVVIGLIVPFAVFLFDHLLRWDDSTAALTTHGIGGLLGLIVVGILANGRSGAGWNAIGAEEYLGVARQGVTGLLAAAGFRTDFPNQLQAQLIGAAALALFGFFAAWIFLAPLATAAHLLKPRPAHLATDAPALADADTPGAPPGGTDAAEPEAGLPEPA
jgi:Amt family ammonium transporter